MTARSHTRTRRAERRRERDRQARAKRRLAAAGREPKNKRTAGNEGAGNENRAARSSVTFGGRRD